MTKAPAEFVARPAARVLLSGLIDAGVSHVVGLPDNTSAPLFALLQDDESVSTLTVTREGEAFAIASGLWLGGMRPVVVIQNTGLLESGDSLRGTALRMRVPLLCLITYRGYATVTRRGAIDQTDGEWSADTLATHDVDSVALLTKPTLRAWGIPYYMYSGDDDAPCIPEAWNRARDESRPVGLLLTHWLS